MGGRIDKGKRRKEGVGRRIGKGKGGKWIRGKGGKREWKKNREVEKKGRGGV